MRRHAHVDFQLLSQKSSGIPGHMPASLRQAFVMVIESLDVQLKSAPWKRTVAQCVKNLEGGAI